MEFDLEYKLKNLEERAKEFFDENGEAYTGIIFSLSFAQEMWKTLKELKIKILELEGTTEKSIEFKDVVKPMIKYLYENHHPHTTVIVTSTNAELLEGQISV